MEKICKRFLTARYAYVLSSRRNRKLDFVLLIHRHHFQRISQIKTMPRKRSQSTASKKDRSVRAKLVEEADIPPMIWEKQALDVWRTTYVSPESIVSSWEFEAITCQCPRIMSEILFHSMSGMSKMPLCVRNDIKYTMGRDTAIKKYPPQQVIDIVAENPIHRFDRIPKGGSITISVNVEGTFLPWIRIAHPYGSFKAYACREFKKDEVVSVCGGKCIWRSDAPYVDCADGADMFPTTRDTPVVYCRARDGLLQALDPNGCHLLLGGGFFSNGEKVTPNVRVTDAGEYIAVDNILIGEELSVYSRI